MRRLMQRAGCEKDAALCGPRQGDPQANLKNVTLPAPGAGRRDRSHAYGRGQPPTFAAGRRETVTSAWDISSPSTLRVFASTG